MPLFILGLSTFISSISPNGAWDAFSHIPGKILTGETGPMPYDDLYALSTPKLRFTITYLEMADRIILEVNVRQDLRLEGMHDILGVSPRHGERTPIPILRADDPAAVYQQLCEVAM